MAEIAVVHMDLTSKGGGEAVSMNVIEALQRDHDVTLMTLYDPNISELNDYFNTAIDEADLSIHIAGQIAPNIHRRFGIKYYILQNALLGKYAARHAHEFDLLVSTINELGIGPNAIQYIHFPFDWSVNLNNRADIFHPTVKNGSLYERLCTWVADVSVRDFHSCTLLTNSNWTADAVENAYGIRPKIIYPPVDTDDFYHVPWSDRENGFVTVGRIERSKRIHQLIRIVDRLRSRGHRTHLHVIGPTVDPKYRNELDAMSADRDHVTIEGELPRSDLVDMICHHRYGLHGKRFEHFGMSVAELIAGGAIPFVPDSGGQREIVHDRSLQTFSSVGEAIENTSRVLSDTQKQRALRRSTSDIERLFGRDRFKREFLSVVSSSLDRSAEPAENMNLAAIKGNSPTD